MQIELFLTLRKQHAFKRVQQASTTRCFFSPFSFYFIRNVLMSGRLSVQWRCRLAPHSRRRPLAAACGYHHRHSTLLPPFALPLAWHTAFHTHPFTDSPRLIGSWHPLCHWSRSNLRSIFAYLFYWRGGTSSCQSLSHQKLWRGRRAPSPCF